MRSVATDYLPADVQAALASASVLWLVGLALVSDLEITIDHKPCSRFVRVQGSRSQPTVREHPILGPVSVFERYGDLHPSVRYAMGDMTCGERRLDMHEIWQSNGIRPDRTFVWTWLRAEHPQYFREGELDTWLNDTDPHPDISEASLTASVPLLCDAPNGDAVRAFPYERLRPAAVKAIKILSQKVVIWSDDVFTPMVAENGLGYFSSFADRAGPTWLLRPKSAEPRRDPWLDPGTLKKCMGWTTLLQKDETGSLGTPLDQRAGTDISFAGT